ncbi:mycothiol transferase [Flexivirga endophytica]|nr:DinB family protein [Flexivirga endophytica]
MAETADVTTEILTDAFTRVREGLPQQLDGLTAEQVLWRPGPDANPIGWLAWHLARVQDDHLAGVGDVEQAWTRGWSQRFGLPYDDMTIGYGQTSDEVGRFSVTDTDLLVGYYSDVHDLTLKVLQTLRTPADYERIVDERWDPPVTAAVRITSVIGDITQHLGQLSYVRGLLDKH